MNLKGEQEERLPSSKIYNDLKIFAPSEVNFEDNLWLVNGFFCRLFAKILSLSF